MYIQIEPESNIPIYEQVRNSIMEGIVRGDVKPGDVLPSVRSLAGDLGVNMHTVNKSYHELERKGVIRIVPKSGAVICERHVGDVPTERVAELSQDLRPLIVEALVAGMSEKDVQALVQSIMIKVKEE
ncbi:GntR family transcriptional regulator [Metabacillus iocasae]|uniref:GntR family transcriptional regulator n=1 Tax=Priestia iocasae TaxID=2291674 RepID=A0ABS2QV28_9BACI|nr:GntR family transcriptional regulator [Metabacillus iocasae]MBM7702334.1 GntR family transcriptional regulator [Metabacillus iocasae]